MMNRVLQGVGNIAAVYLDDIVIHSATWEEHLQHISKVLEHLRATGLTAKSQKRQFAMSHIWAM